MKKQITLVIEKPEHCLFRRPVYYRDEDGVLSIRKYLCNAYDRQGISCHSDKFDINCPLLDAVFDDELTPSRFGDCVPPYHKPLFR